MIRPLLGGDGWKAHQHTHSCMHVTHTHTRRLTQRHANSFEILFLSTKTIKSSGALMFSAALQVRRESVSLS